MVGITEMAGVMTSLKSAKDILEVMVGLRDEQVIRTKVLELQSRILDAQSSAFAAQEERGKFVDRIKELEQEVARLASWEDEKALYELADAGNGTRAYRFMAIEKEPEHWLCPTCFSDGKKSILQPETCFPGRTEHLICHKCDTDLIIVGARELRSPSTLSKR